MTAARSRALISFALAASAALVLAACGSGDDSSTSTPTSSSGGPPGSVNLADSSALGTQILVDAEGRTLYLFEKDTSADASACSGACAKEWPPLTAKGAPTAGSGLDSSQLTTLKRDDGSTQVAYAGHPLYLYEGDSAPGDTNGNGLDAFGAEWYAVDSSGEVVEGSSVGSGSGDSTSDDSGSGYSPSY